MELIDRIKVQRYHRDRIAKYGSDALGALGWRERTGLAARFEILTQIGNLDNCSVLDAGCGHGDLRGFLNERFTGLRYIGVDLEESFLNVAIAKYGHLPDTAFFAGDFTMAELPVTDYILVSGALSYRSSDPDFVYKAISKLFDSCRLGLAFNLLRKVDNPYGMLVAYDPQKIVEHCRNLSPDVILREGYYEEDFTVMLNHT